MLDTRQTSTAGTSFRTCCIWPCFLNTINDPFIDSQLIWTAVYFKRQNIYFILFLNFCTLASWESMESGMHVHEW